MTSHPSHMASALTETPKTNTTSKPVRVVVVDDHPFIRMAFRDAEKDHPWLKICGEAGDVAEALTVIRREQPDVAIVDLSLKEGASGLELIHQVASRFADVRMLVFSMYDEAIYAERCIRAGASGYLMKSEEPERVIQAIQTVANGGIYLSPEMSARMLAKKARPGKQAPSSEKRSFLIDTLSDREMTIFQMMGDGLDVDEICHRLGLNRKTVEGHRRNAKDKLGLDSINDLIRYAIEFKHAQAAAKL